MAKTREQNHHFIFLAIIALLGIIAPMSFFKNNLPLAGLDTMLPIDIHLRMKEWPYLWGYFSSMLGADFSGRIIYLPQLLSYVVMNWLGLSLVASQKIIFIQIFLTAGFSMYFLSSTIWKKRPLIAFIAALIFMFNPVMAGFWQQFLSDSLYSFVALPLVLGLFLRGLETSRILKPAILFSFSTLLFLPYNPAIYAIGMGVIGIFFVFNLFGTKDKIKSFKFAFLALVLTLLLNLWWIIPQAISLPKFISHYGAEIKEPSRLVSQSTRAYLPNTIRLLGNSYWGYSLWNDEVSNYIGFLYETEPILIWLSFIYPFFAFLALSFRRRDKTVVFLTSLGIVSLFLAKGVSRPFGSVYDWLFQKVPGFFLFRTPSDKFWIMTLLTYSLLIGFSITEIFNWLAKKSKALSGILVLVTTVIFLAVQWPFFTGDVIPNGKSAIPSLEFKPPSYYQELSNWLKEQKGSFRILNLPGANRFTRWLVYKWGFLGAYPLLAEFLGRPVVDKQPQAPSDFLRLAAYYQLGNFSDISTIIDQQLPMSKSVSRILGLMNIRYVLVNHDVEWQHLHYGSESPEELERNLSSQEMIEKERDFGNLHLYRLKGTVLPEIYSASADGGIEFFGNKKQLGAFSSFDDYLPENGFYLNPLGGETAEKREIFIGTDYRYYRETFSRNYTNFPPFPFIRLLPDNPLYSMVELRDFYREKKFREDPPALILTKLDLADKRMAEIDKMIKTGNFSGLAKAQQKYEETIREMVEVFEKGWRSGETVDTLALDVRKRLNYQENFLVWAGKVLENKDEENVIKKILVNFPNWYSGLGEFIRPWWFDDDLANERGLAGYEFRVPEEGEYNLLLNTHDLESVDLDQQGRFKIEGGIVDRSGTKIPLNWVSPGFIGANKWISLGKFFLKSGDYTLVIANQRTRNLLGANYYWRIFGDGKNWPLSDDPSTYQMEVERRKAAAFYTTFPNPDSSATYRVSFSYRNISGKPLRVLIFKTRENEFSEKDFEEAFSSFLIPSEIKRARRERTGVKVYKSYTINVLANEEEELIKESIWQRSIFDCHPGEGANVVGLVFFIDEDKSYLNDSINQINDLRVERVFDNPIVFRQTKEREILDERPEIFFKRINPTRYEVGVKGAVMPFKLVFNESFDPDWRAYIVRDGEKIEGETVAEYVSVNAFEIAPESIFFRFSFLKKPGKEISRGNHFLINGYANGWSVDELGDYKIILLYQPQRYFYYCLIISISIMIILSSYFFLSGYPKNSR